MELRAEYKKGNIKKASTKKRARKRKGSELKILCEFPFVGFVYALLFCPLLLFAARHNKNSKFKRAHFLYTLTNAYTHSRTTAKRLENFHTITAMHGEKKMGDEGKQRTKTKDVNDPNERSKCSENFNYKREWKSELHSLVHFECEERFSVLSWVNFDNRKVRASEKSMYFSSFKWLPFINNFSLCAAHTLTPLDGAGWWVCVYFSCKCIRLMFFLPFFLSNLPTSLHAFYNIFFLYFDWYFLFEIRTDWKGTQFACFEIKNCSSKALVDIRMAFYKFHFKAYFISIFALLKKTVPNHRPLFRFRMTLIWNPFFYFRRLQTKKMSLICGNGTLLCMWTIFSAPFV